YGSQEAKNKHTCNQLWRQFLPVKAAFYPLNFFYIRCRKRFNLPYEKIEGNDNGTLEDDNGSCPDRKAFAEIINDGKNNVNGKDQPDPQRKSPAVDEKRIDKQPGELCCT